MSPSCHCSDTLFQQSEKGYMSFFQTYLHMLLSFVDTLEASVPDNQKNAEQQLIVSLNLLEKMVMHLDLRDIWLEIDWEANADREKDEEVAEIKRTLSELTRRVRKQYFVRYSNKHQCLQILSQLSRYLLQYHVQVFDENAKPTKPWINPASLSDHKE